MSFKVVEVRTVAVNIFSDRMSCSVDKVFSVPRLSDYIPCYIIVFPAFDRYSQREFFFYEYLDSYISSIIFLLVGDWGPIQVRRSVL